MTKPVLLKIVISYKSATQLKLNSYPAAKYKKLLHLTFNWLGGGPFLHAVVY
jgi:hypothetical protein